MRLIKIELEQDKTALINPEQVSAVYVDSGDVVIKTSDGSPWRTKFTDVDHAVDYLQRASSHSLNG